MSMVIDYMYTLCHIQLIQIDCAVHYVVRAWKINKYGRNPTRLSPFPSDLSWSETDHASLMCTAAAEGGRWCRDTIQTWPIQSQLLSRAIHASQNTIWSSFASSDHS